MLKWSDFLAKSHLSPTSAHKGGRCLSPASSVERVQTGQSVLPIPGAQHRKMQEGVLSQLPPWLTRLRLPHGWYQPLKPQALAPDKDSMAFAPSLRLEARAQTHRSLNESSKSEGEAA